MGCNNRLIVPRFGCEDIQNTINDGGLLTMEIEFNSICNFNCPYCYLVDKDAKKNELTKEQFFDVLTQARDLGANTIVILGGEPMLYPHLLEMTAFIKRLGMNSEMYTNGSNITDSIARKLFENNVHIVLKMNTFDEKLQDELSGKKGAYKQIHSAFAALKRAGYPTDKKGLAVSSVICEQNFDELEGLWRWLRDQKITPYFETITPKGNAVKNKHMNVDPIKVQKLFYRLAEIDKEYGFDWNPQPPLVGAECQRHQYSCVVSATGDVIPCVGVTISVGNVKERKLGDIIDSSSIINDLRNYRETIKGPCAECEELENCYGCRGAAYEMTGDYLASDPMCWKNVGKSPDIISLPILTEKLVPHKKPMLIVDRLLEVKEKTVVEVDISEDMVLVNEEGEVDEVAFIEMVAQAMAAHDGFKNAGKSRATEGFLVGINNFKIYGRARLEDNLRIKIRKVFEFNSELAVIAGEVFKNGDMLAEGEIKVWHRVGKSVAMV